MAYLVGALLALAVGAMCTLLGLDRDRALYPAVLIVVASYYALFAVMGGSIHALLAESVAIAIFLAAALVGTLVSRATDARRCSPRLPASEFGTVMATLGDPEPA